MSGIDRKAELAKKKAKLAALREERLKKEENHYKLPTITANFLTKEPVSVDGILKELGVGNDIVSNEKTGHEDIEQSSSMTGLNSTSSNVEKRLPILAPSKIFHCSVDSQEVITYSKQVQTDQELIPKPSSPTTFLGLQSFEWDDEIGAISYDENESQLPEVTQFIKSLDLNKAVRFNHPDTLVKPVPPRDLTEEEKQVIMQADGFQRFIIRASRVVQRALEEPNDIFFDYSGAEREEDGQSKHQLVKYIGDFYDNASVHDRGRSSVIALDWSAVYPELLLAAYQTCESGCAGDGSRVIGSVFESSCCCIWNLKYRQTAPEYTFTYQVDITAAILTEFHPPLVIGGTKGGQIVLWDIRTSRRTPTQMTHLAGCGAAHVEPICGLVMTGSRHANSLVSISSEGRLCAWSLDMLGVPIQTLDLTPVVSGGVKRSSNPITPTCFAFLPGPDANRFLVGAQDGSVYLGSRDEKNAGLITQFDGHKAPVTGIAVLARAEVPTVAEESAAPVGFSGVGPLFATTGMDCCVRLWSVRESPAYPLLAYEDRNDYFVGCDASPIHPALFATTDLSGCLDFWSLNSNREVPTASIQVGGDALLNRCRFHKKGFHLAAGGDDGRVRLFELHENLAMPEADEWNQLKGLVRGLSATAAEEYDVQNPRRRSSHVR